MAKWKALLPPEAVSLQQPQSGWAYDPVQNRYVPEPSR